MSAALVVDALRKMTSELERENDRIVISKETLRNAITDAVNDLKCWNVESYDTGPGYEEVGCVDGDYVRADDVQGLVEKIMQEIGE